MIARDSTGRVIAAQSITLASEAELVLAEAQAALYAVIFSQEMGFIDLILEGDALQIVKAINLNMENSSSYGHFVEGIQTGLCQFRSCSFTHVYFIQKGMQGRSILAILLGRNYSSTYWEPHNRSLDHVRTIGGSL